MEERSYYNKLLERTVDGIKASSEDGDIEPRCILFGKHADGTTAISPILGIEEALCERDFRKIFLPDVIRISCERLAQEQVTILACVLINDMWMAEYKIKKEELQLPNEELIKRYGRPNEEPNKREAVVIVIEGPKQRDYYVMFYDRKEGKIVFEEPVHYPQASAFGYPDKLLPDDLS